MKGAHSRFAPTRSWVVIFDLLIYQKHLIPFFLHQRLPTVRVRLAELIRQGSADQASGAKDNASVVLELSFMGKPLLFWEG
jgi:hypothetical protein